MSHALIDHIQLFGTEFHRVVLPNQADDNYKPDGDYKPIVFQHSDLSRTEFKNCNLSNVDLQDCDISGLRINGVLIEELLKSQS